MQLRILGSGTAIPHLARGASGYALVAGDDAIILEFGPGASRRLPHVGLSIPDVAGVFVSHRHVDHCADLPALLFARNVFDEPIDSPLGLGGPPGHREHIAKLEGVYGTGVSDPLGTRTIVEWQDNVSFEWAGFTITPRQVVHSSPSFALRVERGGRSLVFSGDTAPCDALVEHARGADLCLFECSYPAERPSSNHLNAQTAAEMAQRAGAERLLLTHLYPRCDAIDIIGQVRAAGYTGAVELASDLATYEV